MPRAQMQRKKTKRAQLAIGTTDTRPEIKPKRNWIPHCFHQEDQKLAIIQLPSSAVKFALSPDDKFAAVVVGEGERAKLQIYCIKDFQVVETLQVGSGHVFGVTFAPNFSRHSGYIVAVSMTSGGAMLWHFDRHGRLRDPLDISKAVDKDRLSERLSRYIISSLVGNDNDEDMDETPELQKEIKTALCKAFDLWKNEHKMPMSLSGDLTEFSPDGTFLITAVMYDPVSLQTSDSAPLVLWDLRTREVRQRIPCIDKKIWWVAISPDSRLIACGESNDSVQVWNSQTGQCECSLKLRGMSIRHGAFSPDSTHIALVNCSGASKASVHVHNLVSRKRVSSFQDVADCSRAISWNQDGTLLAILGANSEISLCDPLTNKRVTRMQWTLPSYTAAYPDSIQFVDQGRKLVLVSTSGVTDVYDMLSLALHRFPGEPGTIRNALCASGGSFLAVMEGRVLTFWGLR